MKTIIIITLALCFTLLSHGQADTKTYLNSTKVELNKKWPSNRTINIVYHGHSVPTGYYTGGIVHTFDAYPRLATKLIKEIYPYAVINTITTSIGGEKATQGVLRFESDVIPMRPDVLFIDYALNDRWTDLADVRVAWEEMVDSAIAKGIEVILLTPTPDSNEDILSDDAVLAGHAAQIREIAKEKGIGLVDSYQMFKNMKANGTDLAPYMAQANHINKLGHELVAGLIFEWFTNHAKEATSHFTFEEQKNEGADSIVYAEENVLSATLSNAAVVVDTERGNILSLKQDDGHAKISADPIGTDNFSISFWYNSDDARWWKYLFTFKESQGRDLLGMNIEGWGGKKSFCFYRKDVVNYASSKVQLALNKWHHIVLVAGNGSAQFFLDGVQTHSVDFLLDDYNFTDFYIGSNAGTTVGCKIDDLMFFHDALGATDISLLYNDQKDGDPITGIASKSANTSFNIIVSDKIISVNSEKQYDWKDSTMTLHAVDGRILKIQNYGQSSLMNCSQFAEGMYVLRIGQESKKFYLK